MRIGFDLDGLLDENAEFFRNRVQAPDGRDRPGPGSEGRPHVHHRSHRHSTDEGREPIDLAKLANLGEMAWPCGGGQEILRLVEQVKVRGDFSLDSLAPGRRES
jgi:hypothetical protein